MPQQTGIPINFGQYSTGAWQSWHDLDRITAEDGSEASVNLIGGQASRAAKAWTAGFTIPDGATVNYVKTRWKRRMASSFSYISDRNSLLLTDATDGNETPFGADEPQQGFWPLSLAFSEYQWNTPPTPQQINDTRFGAALAARREGMGGGTGYIDVVEIVVDYTEPPAGIPWVYPHVMRVNDGAQV